MEMSIGPFDFSYICSLPTKRAGLARMAISPVKDTSSRPALVFVHGNMQGAWKFFHWLKVVHDAGIAATAVDMRWHEGLPTHDCVGAGLSGSDPHAGLRIDPLNTISAC